MSDQNSAAPWLTGVIFKGHYEVGHLIARGGMAEVYHAIDLWSDNPVALKVLLPHLSADQTQQQKFFREGSALKKISHEHVVGVLDEGTETVHGHPVMFLVLEYVHGCTLAQLLKLRPVLSVGEMLEVIIPAVEGLSEVHAHRLIHRDLKPANILLEAGSHSIKLSDFGLTRRADQSATGQLMGTPPFVAPEILDARTKVGPPADIFAAGVMMYRMLTGRMPFDGGENDQQVLYHNVHTDIPSVAQLAKGISSDIAGVVNWCTRRQATDRPTDAAELYRVLCDIDARLSEAERAFIRPGAPTPETSLWDDISEITARSGRRLQQQQSIVAVGAADDIIFDEQMQQGSVSAHEQAVRSAAASPFEAYSPTEFTTLEADDAPEASYAPETNVAPVSGPEVTSISGSYTPKRAGSHPADPDRPRPQASTPTDAATRHTQSEAQRRLAPEPWRKPLPPFALIPLGIGALVALLAAGTLGWWLASWLLEGWLRSL